MIFSPRFSLAWISAFVLSAPILGNTKYTTEEGKDATCLTLCDTYWQKFYFIFMLIVFFFIPLLVLIILYLRIARNLVPAQSNDGDEQVIFFYHSQKKIGAPYLPTILVNNTYFEHL